MAEKKIFTQAAISERLKANILKRENVRASLDDGVISSLIDAVAEEFSDGVRFKEYLTRETIWDYARNMTSQIGQAKMVGYSPKRKLAATATITFGIDSNLLKMGGYSDKVYTEDTVTGDVVEGPGVVSYANLLSMQQAGLSASSEIEIPIGTIIQDADSDLTYITVESGLMSSLGDLELDQTEKYTHTNRWTRVGAVQGIERTFTAYGVNGRGFEKIAINSDSVENMAPSSLTASFLKVEVKSPGASEFTEWERLQDIREAGPYDTVFEVVNEIDFSKTYIMFGNNYSGRQLLKGSDVRITYLETAGYAGNIDQSHRLTIIKNLNPIYVPSGLTIYATNMTPIISGANVETLEDIKENAPTQYLTVDTIGSEEAYQSLIESIPGIQRAKVYRGVYANNQTGVDRDTVNFTVIRQDGVLPNEYDILRDVRLKLGRKISPTDIIQYDAPEYIGVSYNIQGYVDDVTRPLQYFSNLIKDSLYDVYKVQNLEFKQSIFHLDVVGILRKEVPGLQAAIAFPEAYIKEAFYENNFTYDDTSGSNLLDFNFNSSLSPFKEIKNDAEYILRVDFICLPSNLSHRSRTILVIPDPETEGEFLIRQFDLLRDIVLTPSRTRAVLSDTLDTYGEKTLAVWHWINKRLLIEDEDYTLSGETMTVVTSLQDKLDASGATTWRIIKNEDDEYYLYYTEVTDISSTSMPDEEDVLDYFDTYGTWQSTKWGSDPSVVSSFESDDYYGDIPKIFAPDETHLAPVEITFLPNASGEQAGTGSIYIKPSYEGRTVAFIPPVSYIDLTENTTPKPCTLEVMALPQSNDLRLEDDYAIFDLQRDYIKVDLKYRTEFDSEFTIAYDKDADEEETV